MQRADSVPSTPLAQPDPFAYPPFKCMTSEEAGTPGTNPSPLVLADSSPSLMDPPNHIGLTPTPTPFALLSPQSPLASSVPPLVPSLDAPPDEPAHHVVLAW